jgi:hypothetical protein
LKLKYALSLFVEVQLSDLPYVYDIIIINHFLISYLVHTCCSLGGPWNLSVSDRYLLVGTGPVTPHASPVTVYAYPVPTSPVGYRTVYYRY